VAGAVFSAFGATHKLMLEDLLYADSKKELAILAKYLQPA
jgi:hypothetical protein